MKKILAAILKRKLAATSIGAVLAAIGGLTAIEGLQPAVERAADYGAKAVGAYCTFPQVDRDRFRAEVSERLELELPGAAVRVDCPEL